MDVTDYAAAGRAVVPVTIGRRYALLSTASGRVDLHTVAAQSAQLELLPIADAMLARDLPGRDLEGIAALLVHQVGGRVVHVARWADGYGNVLAEAGLDQDRTGRTW